MKKAVLITVLLMVVITLALGAFAGCDLTRKVKGAERTFPSKVTKAKDLSFKMDIDYKKGDTSISIAMDCYKTTTETGEEEYTYFYSHPAARSDSYQNLYADGKLYEIVNLTKNAGTYYVKEGVGVDDEGNIMYHVSKKIFLTSVAAFISKAKKDTVKGEEVYRYDVDINGKSISLWYNDEVLVQLYAKFADENGGDAEEYTFGFSDYKFDEKADAAVFSRPNAPGSFYLESPYAFEDWMGVMTSFGGKIG